MTVAVAASASATPATASDWRRTLLGPSIRSNSQDQDGGFGDEETGIVSAKSIPIEEAIPKFDYLALFIGADYW